MTRFVHTRPRESMQTGHECLTCCQTGDSASTHVEDVDVNAIWCVEPELYLGRPPTGIGVGGKSQGRAWLPCPDRGRWEQAAAIQSKRLDSVHRTKPRRDWPAGAVAYETEGVKSVIRADHVAPADARPRLRPHRLSLRRHPLGTDTPALQGREPREDCPTKTVSRDLRIRQADVCRLDRKAISLPGKLPRLGDAGSVDREEGLARVAVVQPGQDRPRHRSTLPSHFGSHSRYRLLSLPAPRRHRR